MFRTHDRWGPQIHVPWRDRGMWRRGKSRKQSLSTQGRGSWWVLSSRPCMGSRAKDGAQGAAADVGAVAEGEEEAPGPVKGRGKVGCWAWQGGGPPEAQGR